MIKISVLGTGCATCKKLHSTVEKVVKDNNIDAEVEYSTDVTRIIGLGLMYSPVLVVEGRPIQLNSHKYDAVLNAVYENIGKS